MATHDYNIANQTAPNFRTDLNNALSAIAANNSSATAPSSTFAGMWWFDTTNDALKIRNEADSAWITLGTFDGSNNFLLDGTTAFTRTLLDDADAATARSTLGVQAITESSYTPTVRMSTGIGYSVLSLSSASGYYSRIGNMVVCGGKFVANGTSTSNIGIELPLSVNSTYQIAGTATIMDWSDPGLNTTSVGGYTFDIFQSATFEHLAIDLDGQYTGGVLSPTDTCWFSVSYVTDAA